MDERGSVKAWLLAFLVAFPLSFGALVGIGCAIGANSCPWSKTPSQTSTDGQTLWLANCAACHGRSGEGTRGGPSLTSGPAVSLTLEDVIAKVNRGRPFAGMPRFEGTLTDEQIRAVAAYVVELRGGGQP